MGDNKKVFISDILRANNKLNNNLYDLIHVIPAKPLPADISKTPSCDFIPKCDKYYVPKKKIKQKVRTVRNIREQFETDVYSDLNAELDKQRNVLLRKIRIGSAREEATKKIAKTVICNDFPVSKDVWHMVINLNPEGHTHSAQYALWNGKSIQLNGSKGGKHKFIFKYDIGESRHAKKPPTKRNFFSYRKQLLQSSLFVKFKPGPLSKKKLLDSSYQKFQYGNVNLVSLPKPALDIQPSYGGQLGPEMTTFLNKTFMRNSNGGITEKWADFSVSVLGINKNGCPIQTNENNTITFDLQYQCCQNRILMRNSTFEGYEKGDVISVLKAESDISSEVKHVMRKILDYVEFNLDDDNLVKTEKDILTDISANTREKVSSDILSKDKCKRRYGELDRLDVTIIKIPGIDNGSPKTCNKLYCTLGCICDSLEFPCTLKTHCGRLECMFKCQCSFSKTCDDLQSLHELIDLDSKMFNSKLAKEEQKFRQTVVLSGQGSVVLNSQKRDWKTSKKYADFYSKMCLKERKITKELRVVTRKLDCKNIEPWCMVHNLYKCFCKGKFTEKALPEVMEVQSLDADNNEAEQSDLISDKISTISCESSDLKSRLRARSKQSEEIITVKVPPTSDSTEKCARVKSYKGRKFSNCYYLETNRKILEMEKNDRSLLKKLLTTIYTCDEKECSQKELHTLEVGQPPSSLRELLNNVVQNKIESSSTENIGDSLNMSQNAMQRLPNKTKLVAWLEASYKQYKERTDQGIVTMSLDPPKIGKVALYPWEFILSRYRERKNLFLITKQKPYRILMAVNTKNTFFESCININDIALTELEKYPVTVKNLLTNATDLKDNFCILCGLSHCWELIGSVTKVNEPKINETELTTFNCDSDSLDSDRESFSSSFVEEISQESCITENVKSLQEKEIQNITNDSDLSKWFVMTVENDFNEIHFYQKGFYVKYDSVIKAINVSRLSGKTVRLSSSQKCANSLTCPQFGIYATPNENDLNVFIGPYERHEPLGIETIKTDITRDNSRQTRGTWIMVNTVDNVRIIDQPLAFLPSTYEKCDMISLESEMVSEEKSAEQKEQITTSTSETIKSLLKNKEDQKIIKTVKPIKIKKPNDLFNLIKIHTQPSVSQEPKSSIETYTSQNQEKIAASSNSNNTLGNCELVKKNTKSYKPVAEIAPQVKIVTPRNESTTSSTFEPSMFILKPEEINKRSLLGQITAEACEFEQTQESMEMDIENFLANSSVCKISNSDVLIISDDEDVEQDSIKDVWIQSTNVENLGWIPAKRNNNNDVCFEFPGFKCTDFYPEDEAFRKLNLVFSRKVYVPKNFQMQWEVVENQMDLKFKKQLKSQDLRPELVMTKRGLRHKHELMEILKSKKRLSETAPKAVEFVKRRKLIMELEDATSAMLEDNTKELLNKTISNKGVLIKALSGANKDMREEMSAKLNALLSDSD